MTNEDKLKYIATQRDSFNIVPLKSYPEPGRIVVTGPQHGNIRGEGPGGWGRYVGYVVQVRLKAGAFGSDLILLRHPDGTLSQHSNQFFYYLDRLMEKEAKKIFHELFPKGMVPFECEDYGEAYTLGNGEHPLIGRVIQPRDDGPPQDNSPLMQIVTTDSSGNKTVSIV